MIQLFKIEWLKIKSYCTFWILFLSFLIFFPAAFYFIANKFMQNADMQIEEKLIKSMLDSPFTFPKIWQSAAWFGGLFFVLIGMLFILLVTNEVQYRTHRQNIIDGWSRMDFLKAKFSMLIFLLIVSTAMVFLCGLTVGYIHKSTDIVVNVFTGVHYVAYFALMALLYLIVAFLIAILVKRTGLAIIVFFTLVCIVDNVLWIALVSKGSQIGYFLPLEVVDTLVPNPFKPAALEKRTVADASLIIGAIAYVSLFSFILINTFRKSDLKT
jgi:ABC-2 type transport system permease protein